MSKIEVGVSYEIATCDECTKKGGSPEFPMIGDDARGTCGEHPENVRFTRIDQFTTVCRKELGTLNSQDNTPINTSQITWN